MSLSIFGARSANERSRSVVVRAEVFELDGICTKTFLSAVSMARIGPPLDSLLIPHADIDLQVTSMWPSDCPDQCTTNLSGVT